MAGLQSTHVTVQGTTPGHQTQVQEAGDHAEASFNNGAGLFWVKEEMPFPGSPAFPNARGPGTVQYRPVSNELGTLEVTLKLCTSWVMVA